MNVSDGGQSLAAENCEAEMSQKKGQGVSGTSGFSCWVCGFSDHRIKID